MKFLTLEQIVGIDERFAQNIIKENIIILKPDYNKLFTDFRIVCEMENVYLKTLDLDKLTFKGTISLIHLLHKANNLSFIEKGFLENCMNNGYLPKEISLSDSFNIARSDLFTKGDNEVFDKLEEFVRDFITGLTIQLFLRVEEHKEDIVISEYERKYSELKNIKFPYGGC